MLIEARVRDNVTACAVPGDPCPPATTRTYRLPRASTSLIGGALAGSRAARRGVHLEAERCVARHLDAARVAPYSVPSSDAIRSRSTSFNGNAMQRGLAIAICRSKWMAAVGQKEPFGNWIRATEIRLIPAVRPRPARVSVGASCACTWRLTGRGPRTACTTAPRWVRHRGLPVHSQLAQKSVEQLLSVARPPVDRVSVRCLRPVRPVPLRHLSRAILT